MLKVCRASMFQALFIRRGLRTTRYEAPRRSSAEVSWSVYQCSESHQAVSQEVFSRSRGCARLGILVRCKVHLEQLRLKIGIYYRQRVPHTCFGTKEAVKIQYVRAMGKYMHSSCLCVSETSGEIDISYVSNSTVKLQYPAIRGRSPLLLNRALPWAVTTSGSRTVLPLPGPPVRCCCPSSSRSAGPALSCTAPSRRPPHSSSR